MLMEPPSHSRPLTTRPVRLNSFRRLPVHCGREGVWHGGSMRGGLVTEAGAARPSRIGMQAPA